MSSIVSPVTGDRPFSESWVESLTGFLLTLVAGVAAGAFALYHAWNAFEGAFSFLEPLGGYWSCTLVLLGAVTAGLVYRNFIRGDETDDDVALPLKFVIIGALAWAISYFAL